MKRLLGVLTLALIACLPLPATAALQQLTSLFVFGDSLSDAGNSGIQTGGFPPPPYYNGQYSNGPVAVQYLWNLYNPGNPAGFGPSLAGGTDYAIGGATTGVQNYNEINPNVPPFVQPAFAQQGNASQLQQFQTSHPAFDPATSLFVVWLFPNDVFYANATGTLPGVVPGSPGGPNVVANGIANIATTIETLAAAGAQHFLVPNLPDLGQVPEFRGTADAPSLSALTVAFNTSLHTELDFIDSLLSAEIVQFDTQAALNAVLANPAAYGFTNTTDACTSNFGFEVGQCNPTNWDQWVFWDGVHPTTRTDQILAAGFQAAVPEPGTLALVAVALFTLAAIGRARAIAHDLERGAA
jgi:phospholipase/lecithinase/hemolysin